MVLGGIQHLQQRGGWIAPPVRSDLVDLVEHEDRITGLGSPEPLDDAAGEGADVRPPMAPDLRLVPHPAQRHADEPPAQGPGNALPEAGLAHAGRAHEAEDRLPRRTVARHARRRGGRRGLARTSGARPAPALLPELLDGQVFEDPVLDLLQVEVVFVQHLTGPVDVDGPAAQLAPGQARHPLEIREDHAVLGRGRREAREPAQLTLRLAPRLIRQAGVLDPAAELGHCTVAPFVLPELPLNGSELLPQVELALLLGEPLLGVGRDLPAQLAHGELALQQVNQPAQLGRDRVHLEELLPHGQVEGNHRRDKVGHVAGIGDVLRGDRQLVGQLRGYLHEPAEDIHDSPPQRVRLRRLDRQVPGHLDPRDRIRLRPDPVQQPDPFDALDHQAHAAVGDPSELVDHAHGSNTVEVLGHGRLRLRIALRHQRQEPVAAHHVVNEPHGARLSDGERDRRQREHDRVPKRQDRERIGDGEVAGATARLDCHQPASARFGSVIRSRPRS